MAIDNREANAEPAAQEADADEAAARSGSGGARGRWFPLALLPAGIVASVFSAWLAMRGTGAALGGYKPQRMYSLPPMVVRLADTPPRYLRVRVALQLSNRGSARVIRKGEQHIVDALVSLLGARRYDEMDSPVKRRILKQMIVDMVNVTVESSQVTKAYFEEFRLAGRRPVKPFLREPFE